MSKLVIKGIKLGEAGCNKCGGRRTLIINTMGIFSRCGDCGFTEWEWTWGDDPEYLDYLSKHYGVSRDDLFKALEKARSQFIAPY